MMSLFLFSGCNKKSEVPLKPIDLSTVNIPVPQQQPAYLYLINMNSHHMVCGNMINDMPQLDNTSSVSGDIMAGFNVTAFLKSGMNTLDARVVSINMWKANEGDGAIHRPDGNCQMVLSANTKEGSKVELTSLHITVEEGKATAKSSKEYPAKHLTDLANMSEHQKGWTTYFSRPFFIKTIPEWVWTKATPFEPTRENMKQLHRAYQSLITLMKNKDYAALKDAYSLSSREKSLAEAGQSTPDDFFNAIDFKGDFSKDGARVEDPEEWSAYTLETYAGGKLVRLEDEYGDSPLRIAYGDNREITYKPYFSLINGKIVLTR